MKKNPKLYGKSSKLSSSQKKTVISMHASRSSMFFFCNAVEKCNATMSKFDANPENDWYVYWINVIIGVVLAGSFIILFYFSIGTTIEGQIATRNINILVDNFTARIPTVVSPQILTDNKTQIEQSLTVSPSLLDSLQAQDNTVAASNQVLLNTAMTGLAALVAFATFLIIVLVIVAKRRNKNWNIQSIWRTLVLPNIVILIAVALTEFSFLYFVAGSYVTTDVNKVQTDALDAAISYAQS